MLLQIIRTPSVSLGLSLIAVIVLLQAMADNSMPLLRYERSLILQGEFWRLASGHFVHAGWGHALLNVSGVVLVIAMFPAVGPRTWMLLLAVSALVTSLGLLLATSVGWYVGFSGVLHGMFAGAATLESRSDRKLGLILLAVLAIKLVYEAEFGAVPGTASMAGVKVITEAHLWGALGGLAAALVGLFVRRSKPSI